jgi:benzoate transport
MDPREIVARAPMTWRQWLAVATCLVLNALDGFDMLAITFAAPAIREHWQVPADQLGIVIAASVIGMALGSLFLSPLADIVGRRAMIVICLVMMSASMLVAPFSSSIVMLAAWRLVTGLGIGAMVGTITAMAYEYANARWRNLAIGLMGVGYPIGGVAVAALSALLLPGHGWQAVLWVGAGATALMIPVVLLVMPESIDFIVSKRGEQGLSAANAVLKRLGHATATFVETGARQARAPRRLDVFSGTLLSGTILLTIAYSLHTLTTYFVLGWVPSIVVEMGHDQSTAALVSMWINIGGVIGGLVFGWFAGRFGLKPATIPLLAGTMVAVLLFGNLSTSLSMKLTGIAIGFCMIGASVGLYALIAHLYPTTLRATGTGVVIGIGRSGAAAGPILAGILMAANVSRDMVALYMAMGSLIAAIAIWILPGRRDAAAADLQDAASAERAPAR